MSNIQLYSASLPANRAERRAQQHVEGLSLAAHVQQARLHAVATATEFGMMRYVQVKRLQNDLEKLCPDAAEGLAMLAANRGLELARSLQQFSYQVG
jgi:hypothetical protein